jgi:hypothetical protein
MTYSDLISKIDVHLKELREIPGLYGGKKTEQFSRSQKLVALSKAVEQVFELTNECINNVFHQYDLMEERYGSMTGYGASYRNSITHKIEDVSKLFSGNSELPAEDLRTILAETSYILNMIPTFLDAIETASSLYNSCVKDIEKSKEELKQSFATFDKVVAIHPDAENVLGPMKQKMEDELNKAIPLLYEKITLEESWVLTRHLWNVGFYHEKLDDYAADYLRDDNV